jgi:hypothetical protein
MTAPERKQRVVSGDEWRKARVALLEAEKEFTRKRDELSRQRRGAVRGGTGDQATAGAIRLSPNNRGGFAALGCQRLSPQL